MTGTIPHSQACAELELLIQADLDGELDAAATASLAAHIQDCPGCAALHTEMTRLTASLRASLHRTPAPARLRAALQARLASPPIPPPVRSRWRLALPTATFAAGAALAASILLLAPADADRAVATELFSGHVRALQPGHLLDVPSSDRHTVKPWFEGRVDFAPAVPDLAADGFPLVGGRLDVIGGRTVAVLVYRHDRHPINVFVWPGPPQAAEATTRRDGFTLRHWSQHGLTFHAVSDLDPADFAIFTRQFQASP